MRQRGWDFYTSWIRAIREVCERTHIHYLQDLTPDKIESFKHFLAKSGLAPGSINIHFCHLSSIFGMAVKWELLAKNPFSGVKKFKTEKRPPLFHSKEQIESVLEVAQKRGQHIYLVFLLGIYAGMRRVDPTGKPERDLATHYRQKAEDIENAGYPRFAATLRSIADSYDQDADRIVDDFKGTDRDNE